MTFYPGQHVGSYKIVELLGQGAMATVYKAKHALLDRYGALKVMHQFLVNDPHFIESFEREAQIIAKLDHPNIVPVFDYADYQGNRYLVMKFIEGISLQTALEDGPIELADIRRVTAAMASALDYAHGQGVLHRDIKPSNIMIDRRGTPYLGDFGLAQAIEDSETSGRIVGTPAYISPEQATPGEAVDDRADLYSLGVVLYQLVVGRVPFRGTSVAEIIHKHRAEQPPLPSSLNPEIPRSVDAMLLKALAKKPDHRYDTGEEMVAAFEEALRSAGIDALNAFERHSLKFSLGKPRQRQAVIPRGQNLPSKQEEQDSPSDKPAINRLPEKQVRRRGTKLDLALIVAFFLALIVLILVWVLITLSNQEAQRPPATEPIPTLAAFPTVVPTDVEATLETTVEAGS
ncbi:MAG: serine/threonine protein kinase [Anaerolineae bacterium]|nr:serine/threonine protein kinase [Anaerolineae bacterium]